MTMRASKHACLGVNLSSAQSPGLGQGQTLNGFYWSGRILLHSAAGKFCGTAISIILQRSCPDGLIHSVLCVLMLPLKAQERRSSARQTDGSGAEDAAGRAESCSPCSPPGTRREEAAGCWAWEGADLCIRAGLVRECMRIAREERRRGGGHGWATGQSGAASLSTRLLTRAMWAHGPHLALGAKML